MKNVIIFLFGMLLLPTTDILAQTTYESRDIIALMDLVRWKNRSDNKDFKYDGTPYLDEEFVPGTIFYSKKYKFENIPLRYNIFNDEIEYKVPGKETVYAIASYQPVNKVIIGNDTFMAGNFFYEEAEVMEPGFFKILVSGKIDLLLKMEVDFMEEQAATAWLDAKPAEFLRRPDDFFYHTDGQNPKKIHRIKKMIKEIGKFEEELLSFKKEHKISPRNEEELIQFFTYFNDLLNTTAEDTESQQP